MVKICLQCEKEFKTYNQKINHCSRKCAIEALRQHNTIVCSNCNKSFERQACRTRKGVKNVFCSVGCHKEWRHKHEINNKPPCPICGGIVRYGRVRCCSHSCQTEYAKKHVKHVCENCGKEFDSFPSAVRNGRRYCTRKCCIEHMVGEHSPHWRGGESFPLGKFWEKIRYLVLERDKVCRNCRAKCSPKGRELDIHHINGRRNYKDQDEANILKNLAALCSPCHTKLEMAITHNHVESLPIRLKVLASSQ